ncbi:hypothetical protein LOZ65_005870 [Ophidiomyces ophidiicola]|nr:hypothetical protein LOZ65_005870 [Ophidiomyces ophidiicola]
MLNSSGKRQREHELNESHEPVIQQKKKPRPLPLRTSPVLKHARPNSRNRPEPSFHAGSTITPNESSDDDPMQADYPDTTHTRYTDPYSGAFNAMRTPYAESDSDLEMADSQPRSASMQPLWSAGSGPSRPESSLESPIPSFLLNRSLNVSGGRTATPIFSHFTSNMNTDSMMGENMSSTGPQVTPTAPTVPPDETAWWRRRRLPSPISEDESPTNAKCPEGVAIPHRNQAEAFSSAHNPSGIRISVTPVRNEASASGSLHAPTDYFTPLPQTSAIGNQANVGVSLGDIQGQHEQLSAPPTRPASQASHLSEASTAVLRPRKLTIAMGFRADCEKCQQRVPGHYSHIIRS